jgi:hypothetical protein
MLRINDINRLYLGVQGENLAKTISIDASDWLVDFPGGVISIWHKRNGDSIPTPTGATLNRETGVISWSPTSTDTYVSGEGEAEIRLTESNIIKKSKKVVTGVSKSVTGADGEALDSDWQAYIDAVERSVSMAILKDGHIKFHIDEETGHLIFSYTDEIPVVDDEEEQEEADND